MDSLSGLSFFSRTVLRLVYRDTKQENIGFDVRGDVKVFDFGLCKGLSPSLRARDRNNLVVYGYKLTARTGEVW